MVFFIVPSSNARQENLKSGITAQFSAVPNENLRDRRVQKACDRCKIKKAKCTGVRPCFRCRQDNTICSTSRPAVLDSTKLSSQYVTMLETEKDQLLEALQRLYRTLQQRDLVEDRCVSLSDYDHTIPSVNEMLDMLGVHLDDKPQTEDVQAPKPKRRKRKARSDEQKPTTINTMPDISEMSDKQESDISSGELASHERVSSSPENSGAEAEGEPNETVHQHMTSASGRDLTFGQMNPPLDADIDTTGVISDDLLYDYLNLPDIDISMSWGFLPDLTATYVDPQQLDHGQQFDIP